MRWNLKYVARSSCAAHHSSACRLRFMHACRLALFGVSAARGHTIVDGSVAGETVLFPRQALCGEVQSGHVRAIKSVVAEAVAATYGPASPCTNLMLVRRTGSRCDLLIEPGRVHLVFGVSLVLVLLLWV
jgi:hypothetical protein